MPTVRTASGVVDGLSRERHFAYYGIPYAAPPTGRRRFRAPEAPEPWAGVRPATERGLAAPQTTHPIPGFAASGPQDEDCLNLNVFTPAPDGARRPVMFWIHGGGFTHGSGYEDLYNGGPLAVRGDVVVVTINYRLGALGFLHLGDHLADEGLTANAGLLDIIAALQWTRDNIAAFGGDPGQVTIFGESAGAAAVGTLLAMPAAAGLFHRAILQSGTGRGSDRATAASVTDLLLEELGLDRARASEVMVSPARAIVEAQTRVTARGGRTLGLRFGPTVDGLTLPEQPLKAVRAGRAAGIPVVVGTNRDEVKLFAASVRRDPLDDAALIDAVGVPLGQKASGQAADLVALYRRSRVARGLPHENLDILDAIDSDLRFRVPAMRMALAQATHQPRTHLYLFTYHSPARRGALGSCHALEMPFVFGTLDAPTQDRFAGTGPDVERLSANMMDAWLAFARASSPGHEGIGPWPAYEPGRRPTMVFDTNSGAQDDPFGDERLAIEPLVP